MTAGRRVDRHHDPGVQAKVDFLCHPDSHAERPSTVEALETHMSWVFLTDEYAYKLKKPVRHSFLDFSTLSARKADCEAEVRLNRRLAPDVYLGIVPLTLDAAGRLLLDGAGVPVDWLVKMRRLPRAQMLDERISRGGIEVAELDPAALLLARFYDTAPPVALDPQSYRRRFEADIETNQKVLSEPRFAMPRGKIRAVTAAQIGFLAAGSHPLEGRVRNRHIVEGHGDLRPEHIFLGPGPAVIDCLEFNGDFRILDPSEELAFLAMECDFLGAGFIGRRFLEVYRSVTGDAPPETLLSFYKGFRACLRCRLALWHIADPQVADPQRWHATAMRYLDLADGYARRIGVDSETVDA